MVDECEQEDKAQQDMPNYEKQLLHSVWLFPTLYVTYAQVRMMIVAS